MTTAILIALSNLLSAFGWFSWSFWGLSTIGGVCLYFLKVLWVRLFPNNREFHGFKAPDDEKGDDLGERRAA